MNQQAEFVSRYVTVLDREIHYLEWGTTFPGKPVVVMWHGLARTCRDFDFLARHLSHRFRVIAVDCIGRGLSQWAEDSLKEYCFEFIERLVVDLLQSLNIDKLHWIGTSMGGMLGIRLAGGVLRDRITRLIINDVGPEVPEAAIARIRSYAGRPPSFRTLTEYEGWVRQVYKPFGALSDAHWRHLAETTARRRDDGTLGPHYDPRIVQQFEAHAEDYVAWEQWQRIACPVLVFRGEETDLLPVETVLKMRRTLQECLVLDVKGCGHTPQLAEPEEMKLVRNFLAVD